MSAWVTEGLLKARPFFARTDAVPEGGRRVPYGSTGESARTRFACADVQEKVITSFAELTLVKRVVIWQVGSGSATSTAVVVDSCIDGDTLEVVVAVCCDSVVDGDFTKTR